MWMGNKGKKLQLNGINGISIFAMANKDLREIAVTYKELTQIKMTTHSHLNATEFVSL